MRNLTDIRAVKGRLNRMLEETRLSIESASLDEYTRAAVDALLDQKLLFSATQLIESARLYDGGTNTPSITTNTPDGVVLKQIDQVICRLLQYEVMSDRQTHIGEISAHSCQWVSDNGGGNFGKSSNLSSWLENGCGLYLIAGNEGSGKSTLMKHIFNDQRTTRLLKTWASSGSKPLVTASFSSGEAELV